MIPKFKRLPTQQFGWMDELANDVQHLLGSVEHHGGLVLDVGPLHCLGQHRGGVSEGLSDVVHSSGNTQLKSRNENLEYLLSIYLPNHCHSICLVYP